MIDAFVSVSKSHEGLLSHLEKSLPQDMQLNVCQEAQFCESAVFGSPGWLAAMKGKVEMLIQVCERWTEGEIVLHLDADVQFFVPEFEKVIRKRMLGLDLCGQNDGPEGAPLVMCGGFFSFRISSHSHQLFSNVLRLMQVRGVNDQIALNRILSDGDVSYGWFPNEEVWSPRTPWKPGDALRLPKEVKVHHANWTEGVDFKIRQLEEAQRILKSFTVSEQ